MRSLVKILRRFVLAGAILAAIPVLLTCLYTMVMPVSTLMLARMATGQPVDRVVVSLNQIAAPVPALLIASEDGRFCHHWGVDWRELAAVLQDEDGPSRGASTLSMQVTRNLFLWQGTGLLGAIRKGLEIPLAVVVDLILSKRRMMEIYLNIAEWGPDGEFGIEAGSRYAFAKSAAMLTRQEAALLVSILPNPIAREASEPSARTLRKAAIISRRAAQADTRCVTG